MRVIRIRVTNVNVNVKMSITLQCIYSWHQCLQHNRQLPYFALSVNSIKAPELTLCQTRAQDPAASRNIYISIPPPRAIIDSNIYLKLVFMATQRCTLFLPKIIRLYYKGNVY